MISTIWLITSGALAGYGDPIDGIPTPAEREVHLWTNAVRVEPDGFTYPCPFDEFQETEKVAKLPLLWNDGLGEAARYHSEDMLATGNFSHDSSDGTPFDVRVGRYYQAGMAGENIAMGYSDPYDAVINGWMCSSGHRANIMLDQYNELGTGVAGGYYTQDFGGSGASLQAHPVLMAAHTPAWASVSATVLATVYDATGMGPTSVEAFVNGAPLPMVLTWGDAGAGVYSVDTPAGQSCTTYVVVATFFDGSTARYPEGGRYGFGACDWTDAQAQFVASGGDAPPDTGDGGDDDGGRFGFDPSADDDDDDDDSARGCSTAGAGGGLGWLLASIGLALRARRERSRA